MSTRIRLATLEDGAAVAHVHVTTWQDAYRGMIPDDYLDSLDADARVAAYEQAGVLNDPDRPLFVYEHDGTIVGFAMVGRSEDDPETGQVYAIYVLSSHWGTDAGATLMTGAEDWLRERFSSAALWVLEQNMRARRFYEKRGWFADGTFKDDDRGSFVLREVRYVCRLSR